MQLQFAFTLPNMLRVFGVSANLRGGAHRELPY